MKTALVLLPSGTIVVGISVVDTSGNAITSGQTVNFSIERRSDGMWWNTATSAFDLASEPGSPAAAAQDGSTGIYELSLASAFDGESLNYKLRINLTGTVAKNYYINDATLETSESSLALIGNLFTLISQMRDELSSLKQTINLLTASIERTKKGRR